MSNEKRRSYRYRVQEERQKATVLHGRKEWAATLLNESAGGFLFSANVETGLQPGDTVTLRAYSGAYLVQIVHVRPEGKEFHFGVRRFDDELELAPCLAVHRGGFGRSTRHSLSSLAVLGAYVCIAILAGVVFLGGFAENGLASLAGNEPAPRYRPSLHPLPSNVAGPIDGYAVRSLDGINSLASDQVRDAIGLTYDQEHSLNTVFADTTHRLRKLYEQNRQQPVNEWGRHSSEIVNEAVQRVLCTLTDRQIEQWRQELMNASSPPHAHGADAR